MRNTSHDAERKLGALGASVNDDSLLHHAVFFFIELNDVAVVVKGAYLRLAVRLVFDGKFPSEVRHSVRGHQMRMCWVMHDVE